MTDASEIMKFRKVKQNLVTILGNASTQRYRVAGYEQQGSAASEFLENDRRVQVTFSEEDFPDGLSSINGPFEGDINIRILLTASASAQGDLVSLMNMEADPEQRASALSRFQDASEAADESIDELIDIVFNVVLHGNNIDVGGEVGEFTSRRISSISKDPPLNTGDHVAINAVIRFECRACDITQGDTGIQAGSGAIDITNDINKDTNEKTGTIIE